MKHGHRFLMVALVTVVLALPANPGLATISSCTEGHPRFLRQLAGKDEKAIRDAERWESL